MSLEELERLGNYGRVSALSDRWKILYSEQNRSPTNSVQHYISYLRKHVSDTGYARTTAASSTSSNGSRTRPRTLGTTRESINPMSYFLRKLKLDLKLAYANFVTDFVQAPNNGLRLLLALLKNLQILSSKSVGSLPRSEGRGTPGMDDYKRSMIDEQDCLLCIKYTLRIPNSLEELLDDNSGLLTVATCLLSNFSGSRVTALEILTLLITGPSSVDKILEAFTSMRLQYGESTRFKMLTSMMHTRGATQNVLFQVNCLHLLNNLLNMCRSSNMRVFLQYELEEAGLNLESIQKNAQGDGLEFDDLQKEIREWKTRYIDVDTLLRKIKSDMKKEFRSEGISEYYFDQKYGNQSNGLLPDNDLSWVSTHENGYVIDYDKWMHYVQTKQQEHDNPKRNSGDIFLRRGVYVPDPKNPNKTLSNQSQLTDDKIPSPTHLSKGKYRFGHHDENEETSLYDVISVSTSVCESESENVHNNMDDPLDHISRNQKGNIEPTSNEMKSMPPFIKPKQTSGQTYVNSQKENENWHMKMDKSTPLNADHRNTFYSSEEDEQDRIERHDSGVSINYRDPDSQGHSGTKSFQNKSGEYGHFFYTGSNPDNLSYQESVYTSPNVDRSSEISNNHVFENPKNQSQFRRHRPVSRPLSDKKGNDQSQRQVQNPSPAIEPGRRWERNSAAQRNGSKTRTNIRPRASSLNRIRTPSPDYISDTNSKTVPPKLPASRPVSYPLRPSDQPSHQKSPTEKIGGKPVQSSYPSSDSAFSRFKPITDSKSTQNNLSPKLNSNILKQNGFNQVNQNSPLSTDVNKQSVFEDKVIPNGISSNDSEGENKNPSTLKKQTGNMIRESKDVFQKVTNGNEDGEVYTNEVDKILEGLDETLEQHGWKDSIKSVRSTKVPFVAYI